jgi:hypothetical protein
MKRTPRPSRIDLAQLRKPVRILWNRDDQSVVRNLEFYRDVEAQLLAKRSPRLEGRLHLSLWRAEW